jgi:rubrerythrin
MTQETATRMGTGYPVDDATYNLLQALTSKLEAIEAYEQYVSDDPESVFGELLEDERRHAQLLHEALRRRLSSS